MLVKQCTIAPSLRLDETKTSSFLRFPRRAPQSFFLSFEKKWQRVKRQDGEFCVKSVRNPIFSAKSCTMRAKCLNETIHLSLLDFFLRIFLRYTEIRRVQLYRLTFMHEYCNFTFPRHFFKSQS